MAEKNKCTKQRKSMVFDILNSSRGVIQREARLSEMKKMREKRENLSGILMVAKLHNITGRGRIQARRNYISGRNEKIL